MSHNWSKFDFAAALATTTVAARDLLPGDVVVDDYGPWQVDTVTSLPDGRVEVIDEDANGGARPPDAKVRIVTRGALRVAPRSRPTATIAHGAGEPGAGAEN